MVGFNLKQCCLRYIEWLSIIKTIFTSTIGYILKIGLGVSKHLSIFFNYINRIKEVSQDTVLKKSQKFKVLD
jgi:hypothetical protein